MKKRKKNPYDSLTNSYERKKMHDRRFKRKKDEMGEGYVRRKRMEAFKIVLMILGAFLVISLGYFLMTVMKQVNAKPEQTPQPAISEDAGTPQAGRIQFF